MTDSRTGVRLKKYGLYYTYGFVENAGAYLRIAPAHIFMQRIGLQRCKIASFVNESIQQSEDEYGLAIGTRALMEECVKKKVSAGSQR